MLLRAVSFLVLLVAGVSTSQAVELQVLDVQPLPALSDPERSGVSFSLVDLENQSRVPKGGCTSEHAMWINSTLNGRNYFDYLICGEPQAKPVAPPKKILAEWKALSIENGKETVTLLVQVLGYQPGNYFDLFPIEKLWIEVNGNSVAVPHSLLGMIVAEYTQSSYTYYTKQIHDNYGRVNGPTCPMGGPAEGTFLSVYFHDTPEENIYQVNSTEVKPILAQAENCLFLRKIYPENPQALQAAKSLSERLQTIGMMFSKTNK